MYFTRETETLLNVLAACARRSDRSLAAWEITDLANCSAEEIARSVSLLLRHGLLKASDGRVSLAMDPSTVTLRAILRMTQPDLARPRRRNLRHREKNIVALAVEAASSNFLRIAEQFTVADFIMDRPSEERGAVRGPSRPIPHQNVVSG